jgi:hypothetical protein
VKAKVRVRSTGLIKPLLWVCRCGQFNNVAENRCMACGWKR